MFVTGFVLLSSKCAPIFLGNTPNIASDLLCTKYFYLINKMLLKRC